MDLLHPCRAYGVLETNLMFYEQIEKLVISTYCCYVERSLIFSITHIYIATSVYKKSTYTNATLQKIYFDGSLKINTFEVAICSAVLPAESLASISTSSPKRRKAAAASIQPSCAVKCKAVDLRVGPQQ